MSTAVSLPPVTTPLHFSARVEAKNKASLAQARIDPALLKRAEASERFAEEIQNLNLRNARLGAWFVMILVPFCSVLDGLAYPELFYEFLLLRLACSLLCVPLLLALDQPWAARYHRVYPVILPVLPAMVICLMIYLTGNPASGYYAGLLLCLVGTSFVFHWTFRELGLTVGLVLACYFAATVPNLDPAQGLRGNGLFINNTLFILLTCVILYFGSRQHHGIRLREFVNRCKVEAQREELRSRNDELTNTLQRLKETEAQLTQSEKLASIGRLSAGIVHEINNPLNFVKGAVYLMKKKTQVLPEEQAGTFNEILADIQDGVDRVAGIVSDLRTFAHPEGRGSSPVRLEQAVGRALRLMAKQAADQGVALETDISPDLIVLGDENHISQIMINLVQNSLDALLGQPTPRIRIHAEYDTEQGARLHVTDNGPGMPPEVAQRVFDPFFTTKEVGKGLGLGLSLCYRMMQGMGGTIKVNSQPSVRTQFTLTFPPAEAAA
jgi:two-component system sensor histidine kinase PhcS